LGFERSGYLSKVGLWIYSKYNACPESKDTSRVGR